MDYWLWNILKISISVVIVLDKKYSHMAGFILPYHWATSAHPTACRVPVVVPARVRGLKGCPVTLWRFIATTVCKLDMAKNNSMIKMLKMMVLHFWNGDVPARYVKNIQRYSIQRPLALDVDDPRLSGKTHACQTERLRRGLQSHIGSCRECG